MQHPNPNSPWQGFDPAMQQARVCGLDESLALRIIRDAFIRRADAHMDGGVRPGHGEK
jgi:hypothetical protein